MIIDVPAISSKNDVQSFSVQTLLYKNNLSENIVTGLIDDSILEVVQLSLSILKYYYKLFNIDKDLIYNSNIHVHFSNGSIYKEGTSCGLAVFLSILFAFLEKDLSFYNQKFLLTGEIDLYGNILDVGAIDEKYLFFLKNEYDFFFIPNIKNSIIDPKVIKVDNIKTLYKKIIGILEC